LDPVTGAARGDPVDAGLQVSALAFSPDARILAAGCRHKTALDGYAQLWDVTTRRPLGPPLPHEHPIYRVVADLAFHPDGNRLATVGGVGLLLWGTRRRQLLGKFSEYQQWKSVAFSGDGRTGVTGGNDRSLRFWDVATLRPIGLPVWHSHNIKRIIFTPACRSVLTRGESEVVREWEAPPLRYQIMSFPTEGVARPRFGSAGGGITYGLRCLAVSPDGKRVLADNWNRSARLWDMDTGQILDSAPISAKGKSVTISDH
jgi:WD40 repeat protein